MVQPTEVDTSLAGSGVGVNQKTGMIGIDSALSPDLSADMLPIAGRDEFSAAMNQNGTPLNFQFEPGSNGGRADVIAYAKQFLGTPYVWGGTSPNGFDCSGFTQYVAAKFGVKLPRISQNQANVGSHVPVGGLAPGDLVLFPGSTNNGLSGPGHVALYIGGGQIIEAPHTGAVVRIRKLGAKENVYGVHLNYPS